MCSDVSHIKPCGTHSYSGTSYCRLNGFLKGPGGTQSRKMSQQCQIEMNIKMI